MNTNKITEIFLIAVFAFFSQPFMISKMTGQDINWLSLTHILMIPPTIYSLYFISQLGILSEAKKPWNSRGYIEQCIMLSFPIVLYFVCFIAVLFLDFYLKS